MHVPLPDNICLNMLTCWKQEMRSVLELCCKMIQSQEKQGSSARTPVKTLSPFWAERIHGIDGSYKTQHICSRVEPPSSHILGIQVLPVTRGLWSNWQLLFSTYSTANQKNKASENCLSQQIDLIQMHPKMRARKWCLVFSFLIKTRILNFYQYFSSLPSHRAALGRSALFQWGCETEDGTLASCKHEPDCCSEMLFEWKLHL